MNPPLQPSSMGRSRCQVRRPELLCMTCRDLIICPRGTPRTHRNTQFFKNLVVFQKRSFWWGWFLFLEPNWLMAQRISRRNTPTSVCSGRWHVLLLPLGDVQVLDWLIGIPHDTTTYKARMIHKKTSERWKGIEISISLKMLQTLWPENTWDLHNLKNLGQIVAEDLCQSISQTFRSFLHPDFLQFLVSHRFCPSSSDRCDLRGTLHSTKGQSHLRIASQSISQILRSPGTIPESLQFVTLDETAPRNWNSQKENKQTIKGVSMNSRFFIASASAWICGFWAPVPGRSKTWNNECSSINKVRPQKIWPQTQEHGARQAGYTLWTLWVSSIQSCSFVANSNPTS